VTRQILATDPLEPPAQPGMVAQHGVEQFDDLTAIAVADLAAGAEPGRDDGVGRAGDVVDLLHQFDGSLQTGGRGHGQ
jgi:hypothetical protein